jgi:tubulin polyglutamylase TTLL5
VGIDMNLLWSRIYDVILKSIISGEHYVLAAMKKLQLHRNNCFEVFGYDILLDSELKPWLLEVNLSPSLACESPLDTTIKANLIADTFTLIGVRKFDRRKESINKLKNRAKLSTSKVNNFVTGGAGGSMTLDKGQFNGT